MRIDEVNHLLAGNIRTEAPYSKQIWLEFQSKSLIDSIV